VIAPLSHRPLRCFWIIKFLLDSAILPRVLFYYKTIKYLKIKENLDFETLSNDLVFNFAFNSECSKTKPTSIHEKSMFLINLNENLFEDILADENGSYKNYQVKREHFKISVGDNLKLTTKKIKEIDDQIKFQNDIYEVSRYYYQCKSNTNFYRKIVKIRNLSEEKSFNKVFVCYYWKNDKKEEIELLAHQNSTKTSRAFLRSTKTVLNNVKKSVETNKSSSVEFGKALKQQEKNSCISDVPRDTHQFYNHKYLSTRKTLIENNLVKSKDMYNDAIINMQRSKVYLLLVFSLIGLMCLFLRL